MRYENVNKLVMLFVCMPFQVLAVRMVSVTSQLANSRVSTDIWYFSFFLWTIVVGSWSWRKVNSLNCNLEFWVAENVQNLILCASKYTSRQNYHGHRISMYVKPWTFSCSSLPAHMIVLSCCTCRRYFNSLSPPKASAFHEYTR